MDRCWFMLAIVIAACSGDESQGSVDALDSHTSADISELDTTVIEPDTVATDSDAPSRRRVDPKPWRMSVSRRSGGAAMRVTPRRGPAS